MNTGWARWTMQYGLYRDPQHGWVMGVCAGLAQWRGIKTSWVRIGFVLFGLLLHAIPAVLLYAALAVLMKPAPLAGPERFSAPQPPAFTPTLAPLQARFAALDARLNQIEAAVTSEDIALRRQFRDIGI
jgi:phage shock protein C